MFSHFVLEMVDRSGVVDVVCMCVLKGTWQGGGGEEEEEDNTHITRCVCEQQVCAG